MDFKCKYCGGTKYRQISVMIKQCEECGQQMMSEGFVDEKLDFSEEPSRETSESEKLKYMDGLWTQLEKMGNFYTWTSATGTITYSKLNDMFGL